MSVPNFIEITIPHYTTQQPTKYSVCLGIINTFGPTMDNKRTMLSCDPDLIFEVLETYESFKLRLTAAMTGGEEQIDE
jgi:hypothetical protein